MSTRPFLLQQLKPHETAFSRAAASVALQSNQFGTIIDVLHGRAFRYYAEGLWQYLAIRTGSTDVAERHLSKLKAFAAKAESGSLVAPPGIRARLYRAARSYLCTSSRSYEPPDRDAREALPWRTSPSAHLSASPLRAMRFSLREEDSELLELHYARELSLEELAFVYSLDASEIQTRLEIASARAQLALDDHGIRDAERLPRIALEAYALQNRPRTGDDDHGVEPLLSGTIIGGRYAIEARVGLGAFGDVYRAKDTEVPGHVVALKLLHQPAYSEEAKQSALRELRLIASVFHPSIVQFKDHGWFEERLWFVMPWYDGETLESRLKREPLGRSEALKIFQSLARALAAMHSAGVRHQDVKPDNIFLARIPGFGDQEVIPVLLDLGVAATDADMVVAGTPTYFAPEVAAQFSSVDQKDSVSPKADVFALALSLRNALEPDTQDEVTAGAVEAFIEQRARLAPGAPKGKKLRFLSPMFERWMHLDPEERPTADELAEQLAVLTEPEVRRARRRSIMRRVIPLATALAIVSGAVIFNFHQQATAQREEAERAKLAEADLRQDLADTRETAMKLQSKYKQSQLTRTQLTRRLVRTEGNLKAVRGELDETGKRLTRTQTKLDETRQANQELSGELSATTARLQAERTRAFALGEDLSKTERALEKQRQRLMDSRTKAAKLKTQYEAETLKAKRLEDAVGSALAEEVRAQARISELERQIDLLRAAGQ